MTVCLAGIYSNTSILGVSDRMLTSGSGDIEFEPTTKKIFLATRCIAIMTAGDSSIQALLIAKIQNYANERIKAEPNIWIPVYDVAEHYRDSYIELRKNLAEKTILSPLNLTYDTFIGNQQKLSAQFISDIRRQLQNFSLGDNQSVSTIITGVDEKGPHIYVVDEDYLSNNDNVGFAAIGIGGSHARSHLMLSQYSRSFDETKAILNIHRAKKKSEVSPGVGEATDMFMIAPGPKPAVGTFYSLDKDGLLQKDIAGDLDGFYKNYLRRNKRADTLDETKIRDYFNNLSKEIASNKQTTSQNLKIEIVENVNAVDKDEIQVDKIKPTTKKKKL